eukprot:5232458-Pyramimonas_sp.AAC.1
MVTCAMHFVSVMYERFVQVSGRASGPPPEGSDILEAVPSQNRQDETDSGAEFLRPFRCGLPGRGLRFEAMRRLVMRRTKSKAERHGQPRILTTLQYDNTCIVCDTTFPKSRACSATLTTSMATR